MTSEEIITDTLNMLYAKRANAEDAGDVERMNLLSRHMNTLIAYKREIEVLVNAAHRYINIHQLNLMML